MYVLSLTPREVGLAGIGIIPNVQVRGSHNQAQGPTCWIRAGALSNML